VLFIRHGVVPVAVSSRLPGERGLPPRLVALRWLAAAAIGVPIVLVAALGLASWHAAWRGAGRELARSADAVGEYMLRVLDGHRVAADRVNDLLDHLSNAQIQEQEAALHQRLAQLLPDLPLVQTIAVLRPDGLMLLTANVYPVPRESYFADREWVGDLKLPDAPRVHISKLNIGRLDANLFFGVSRRRLMAERGGASDGYDGVINISVQPNKVAAGFADLVPDAGDHVGIVRTDGEILAQWPGLVAPPPPLTPATDPSFFAHLSANAQSAVYEPRSGEAGGLVAFRRLQGFPVVATVTRSRAAIAGRWWQNFWPLLGISTTAMALVAGMAVYSWRRAEDFDRAQAAARFHAVFDASPVGLAVLDAHTGLVLAANDVLMSLTGTARSKAEGFDLDRVLAPESAARYADAITDAKRRGASGPVDLDLTVPGRRRVPVRLSCSVLPGEPPRIIGVVQDVSDLRESEARRELMMREVEHRSKNMLALFQAALRVGASGTSDARELAKAVEGRIAALVRSQSLLTTTGEKGASLRDLIEQEVAPFAVPGSDTGATAALRLDGDDIRVTARAAQALSMVFHELATNAAKYGAFATDTGSVQIRWRSDVVGALVTFHWIEQDGSPLAGGERLAGFGTRLIDTSMQGIGGTVRRHWQVQGLAVEITMPLTEVLAATAAAPAGRSAS